MNKMNVIYLHTHDSGRYISPYGYNVPTPNLRLFANDSTTFRKCFCAAPTCSPSRAAMLTGQTPHQNGMQGLVNRGWHLCDNRKHIASFLSSHGYETVLCGMQHEGSSWSELGYQRFIGHSESEKMDRVTWDLENTDYAVDYLMKHDPAKPFFLSMGWFNTHRPYPKAGKEINSDFIQVPAILPDCDIVRKDMADYMESVCVVDKCFGKIYEAIKKLGLLSNSIIFFTTDHGIAFPQMKCNLFDSGIGVSLMFAYPDNKMKGHAVDSLVSHYDVFPTICDILGLNRPHWLCGTSFAEIMQGEKNEVRNEIFAEVTYHASYEPKRCIRTNRYKYIKCFYSQNIIPANIDESPSKKYLIGNGFLDFEKKRELLFDTVLDPMERINLADKPEYNDIKEKLSAKLHDWMKQTDDPLLISNNIPKPVGALVNKWSCVNPEMEDYILPDNSDYKY